MNKVLLVSIGFSPNVGGIETHFDDLVKGLISRKWNVVVLTYQPLTSNRRAAWIENKKLLTIYRLPIVRGFFYKFVHTPLIEFAYLVPGLFIFLPILLLLKGRSIDVIHSHGLVSGFVSVFWGKIFNKTVVTTTHSIYQFPKEGLYRAFAKWIFNTSDIVLCLSEQSKNEIKTLGVSELKIRRFVYWVDSTLFKRVQNARKILKMDSRFVVLFVGRLIPEKGISLLLESVSLWPKNTALYVIGEGPLEKNIKRSLFRIKKVHFVGKIGNSDLPIYYSAADTLIVPSISEEGFGRVIIEALLCGTPVIGSTKGAIPEAIDNSVGLLVPPKRKEISKAVSYLYSNKSVLENKKANARAFALKHYSETNIENIIESYSS